MRIIVFIVFTIAMLGGIIWGFVTALNQLFGFGIQHTFINYASMLFVMIILRGIFGTSIKKG